MPTFFIIGAAKCGTTSLHAYLGMHPDISMSKVKEPRYFCRHLPDYHLDVIADRDEYLGLFDPGAIHRGEASPQYSSRGDAPRIAKAIHQEAPDALLFYLVRDPVERVASQYAQSVASRDQVNRERISERTGFGAASLAEDIGDIEDPGNPFTSQGRYMDQIEAYMDLFPRESLMVIDSDELKNQRQQTLALVFEFLGLDPVWYPDQMSEEKNRGDRQIREPDSYLTLTRSRHLRRIVDLLPPPFRDTLVDRTRRLVGRDVSKPDLDPDLRKRLEDFYRPHAEALRSFTGKDFPTWSI